MTLVPVGTRLPARTQPDHALFDPWLGNYQSAKTQQAYLHDALLWEAWCAERGVDLLHPRPGHVSAWLEDMRKGNYAESTLARRLSTVLAFYRWARHEELTDANPAPFLRPKVKRDDVDIMGLTREQYLAVLANAGSPRNYAFVSLLGRCGLRVSEALDADVDAVREQSGHRVIRVVGKGNRPRTVPLSPAVWVAIEAYLDGRAGGPMFLTRTGQRWVRRDAWKAVTGIGKRAGIPNLNPHRLRHTAATLMLESGAPLDRVQTVLGHASPETTMRYARARDRLDGSPVYDLARYLAED